MNGIRKAMLWAFISGFLHGLLFWMRDYVHEKEKRDADQSKFT